MAKRIAGPTNRGERIKAFRDFLGKTQGEFGALIGVKKSAVSNYETRSDCPPRRKVAKRIVQLAQQQNYLLTLDQLYYDD